jgi:hypothetical protein
VTRLLPILVGLVVLAGACGDDSGSTSTTTSEPTTTSTTTSTTAPPATTTTVPPTTTTTASPLPTDPQAYATAFVEAWESGDQAAAATLGTQEAVDTIFAYDPGGGPGTWSLVGCEGAAGSSYCTFNAGGDPTVIVRVGNEAASLGQPQAVTEVQVEG